MPFLCDSLLALLTSLNLLLNLRNWQPLNIYSAFILYLFVWRFQNNMFVFILLFMILFWLINQLPSLNQILPINPLFLSPFHLRFLFLILLRFSGNESMFISLIFLWEIASWMWIDTMSFEIAVIDDPIGNSRGIVHPIVLETLAMEIFSETGIWEISWLFCQFALNVVIYLIVFVLRLAFFWGFVLGSTWGCLLGDLGVLFGRWWRRLGSFFLFILTSLRQYLQIIIPNNIPSIGPMHVLIPIRDSATISTIVLFLRSILAQIFGQLWVMP